MIVESIAKLSREFTNIQEKMRENTQRIDERSQSLVTAEQTLQLRKNEIAEIESYEYEHGVDISVMVIITQYTHPYVKQFWYKIFVCSFIF